MITQQQYQQRRDQLLAQMEQGSIAIVASAKEILRNGDAHYRFRQNSDFYYLSGFEEPEALLVLIPGDENPFQLFCRERDKTMEIWNGKRAGIDGACQNYAANKAYPISQLDEIMPQLLADKHTIYYCHGDDEALDKRVAGWTNQLKAQVRKGVVAPSKIVSLQHSLNEMRLIKSEEELNVMRNVAKISAGAHKKAMQQCRHCEHEYQLAAILMHEFMFHGCATSAYDSIVGSGDNACILHYTENNGPLNDGDLVLIDAGGELNNYAADITRTFPVNGRFNDEQKTIYQLVLNAQLAGLECIKPGNPWNSVQETMVKVITQGLVELGLLQGDVDKLINDGSYREFYMHNSGHWLGLDVHDVGDYKVDEAWRPFVAGMVLTVEPGIYIAQDANVESKWQGIGVRIEDDVLVTDSGHEILTSDVPKTIEEIEALMQ